jgi:predicted dehydrogenase
MPDEDIGASYDRGASHAAMVEAFRDVVVNRARPWITPGECLRTVAAVEAAYRSLRTGSWMRVDMLGMREAREPVEARA